VVMVSSKLSSRFEKVVRPSSREDICYLTDISIDI
jgi:hypothetical protein